ncbi:MAG TPA: hypothetical protein VE130_15935 [Nitrososphaeraceae archaeon]|jgi:hypothetical protein|nr:hypothetical protein [Nitrososphaeraceae archaeon]
MTNLITVLAYLGFAVLLFCQSVSYISAQTSNTNTITEVGNNTRIFETFSISGLISSLTFDNDVTNNSSFIDRNLSSPTDYIEAGNWSLKVVDKKVINFDVNFTMVHPDGSDWHYHVISNFRSDPDVPVLLEDDGTTFDGTVDIGENDMDRWFDVQTSVIISNLNTIVIFLDPEGTENHFNGQPIYGVVTSSLDENGNPIFSSNI